MAKLKLNLTKEQVVAFSTDYKAVPLAATLPSDFITPVELLKKLKKVDKNCFLLESVEPQEKWGRYSFLGFKPKMEISNQPIENIREVLNDYKSPKLENLPPFTGGLMGYFSFDFIRYIEPKLNLTAAKSEGFKDYDLMLFDKVIAFDNYRQKIVLMVNIKLDNIEAEYKRGVKELEALCKLVVKGKPIKEQPPKLKSGLSELFTKEQYCDMVEKAKHYIKEGDIFQVVLSNRLEANVEGSLLDVYRALRGANPSPYMFYFYSDKIEVAGASPETLVKLENGKLFTYPLAGTRKRGETQAQDLALEKELLSDEKELAEHNMLVDLGRNDLGKISKFGSVKVAEYKKILKFSHVMHIGSTVSGEIDKKFDALDAICSVLPAGTLSGAPKIRAIEIIDELENCRRGLYGGAIGYLDFTGNMDTCIAIRLAFKKEGKVYIRAGAGVVLDSVPVSEYDECINKMAAVRGVLEQ